MNKARCLSLAVAAAAMAFTLSCTSGDSGGGGGGPIKKPKISGVSQKGPFVEGTRATLYELDGDFAQTGRQFFDIIADSKGTFEIKNVELISPYAAFEADGFYRNEVTGGTSAAPIKLYAIADIREKDNVNVNLLTHLEYYRVLNLIESGKTVAEAKKLAQKEILAVFGISGDNFANSEDMSIFGTTEGDAALLAISVLLQGNLPEGEFSQRLTDFAQSLKTSGTWENEAEKTKMADWAFEADLAGIKSNVLGWELSLEVPDFGKHATNYWATAYGLGACGSSNEGEIEESNRDVKCVCENSSWRKASYKEIYCSVNDCLYFTDSRDGQKYTYVEIGRQSWMTENLNYAVEGSKCYGEGAPAYVWDDGGRDYIKKTLSPDEIQANCDKYGRLYDWETAKTACPAGWRLPSYDDWGVLVNYAGGSSTAGKHLKASSGWNYYSGIENLDSHGFTALPGGYGNALESFADVGNFGYWWSSSEYGSDNAYCRGMYYGGENVSGSGGYKSTLLSVRCVKD